jgi:hypothetical protein
MDIAFLETEFPVTENIFTLASQEMERYRVHLTVNALTVVKTVFSVSRSDVAQGGVVLSRHRIVEMRKGLGLSEFFGAPGISGTPILSTSLFFNLTI